MSVSLTTSPALIAFSADQIFAKFTCTNYTQQLGAFSVNQVELLQPLTAGTSIKIKYAGVEINMVASTSPDLSGKEFLSGSAAAQSLLPFFLANYQLSRDFEITASASNKIQFTARIKKLGYNFTPVSTASFILSNTTPGTLQILKPKYAVLFRLYIENKENTGFNLFYTTKLPLLGLSGQTEISIGDKLHNEIMMDLRTDFSDIPTAEPLKCKKSCRRYYFEFAESFGDVEEVMKIQTSEEFTVLNGGLSYVAQFNSSLLSLIAPGEITSDRFLKQGNTTIYTRSNQPQYLYFFNTRVSVPGAILKAIFHLKDGTSVSKSLGTLNLEALRKYAFNLRYDDITSPTEFGQLVTKYEVYLETAAGNRISEIRTYWMNYQYREFVRYFLSWSSFGSLDSHLCYGKGNSEFELFQKDATKILPNGYDIKQGSSISFDLKVKSSFKVATGWMSRREMLLNRDFFLSPFKYRYTGGLMLPIKVDSKTIPEIKDGENLYSQLFDYSYQFEDHNFTEGDNEEAGISSGDFFFNSDPLIGNPTQGFTEKDPTVPHWVKSITQRDIDKWNTGGNGGGDLSDFYRKSEINAFYSGATAIAGYNKANWDTSYSWGNHSGLYQPLEDQRLSKGDKVIFNELKAVNKLIIPSDDAKDWKIYISANGLGGGATPKPSFTLQPATTTTLGGVKIGSGLSVEIDGTISVVAESPLNFNLPLVRSGNNVSLPGWNSDNWNTSFGWGNHASQGYLKTVAWTDISNRPTLLSQFSNDLGNYGNWINKAQGDAYYSVLGHKHIWSDITNRPTDLSQFTNDLGNYGNWITAAAGSVLFQPLENQRLSKGDSVIFNELTATTKLIIPSTGPRKWKVYVDESGVGGGAIAPVIVSSLWDLTNTLRSGSEQNNQALLFDLATGKWTNKTINVDVDLTSYAKKDGSNTFGTWGINISGSSKYWGAGNEIVSAYIPAINNAMIGFGADGKWGYVSKAVTQTHLDINNGATLNNSISGTAAAATYALNWGGATASFGTAATAIDAPIVIENGIVKPAALTIFRTWLGLGSFAYRNGINGNEVGTDVASAGADIGVAKLLRWKNYANGHVIFDASNGTAPNGSAIDNTNPTQGWNPTYPVLMGWNGAGTFGVRVDSARNSDLWNGYANGFGDPISGSIISAISGQYNDGRFYRFNATALRNFIGSPSGGETLQSITDRGNYTSLALRTPNLTLETSTGNWSVKASGAENSMSIIDNQFGTTYAYLKSGNINLGYTTDQGYKLAVNGTGMFNGPAGSDVLTLKKAGSNPSVNFTGTAFNTIIEAGNDYKVYVNGSVRQTILTNGNAEFTGNLTAPSFRASNWFRSAGDTGWYSETYGGGIVMTDSNWVRVYNSTGFWCDNRVRATDFLSQIGGFKSNNFAGLVGDYNITGTTDKIVWTIGENWNTIENMYGIGYQYSSKYVSGNHQIVFRSAGVVHASIDLDDGRAFFDGMITAPIVKATSKLLIPSTSGKQWSLYVQDN